MLEEAFFFHGKDSYLELVSLSSETIAIINGSGSNIDSYSFLSNMDSKFSIQAISIFAFIS